MSETLKSLLWCVSILMLCFCFYMALRKINDCRWIVGNLWDGVGELERELTRMKKESDERKEGKR